MMNTPKAAKSMTDSDLMSTPSSSSSETRGAIVTPGSSSKGDESPDRVWVKEPHDNDVLCGRGGSINSHPGNERFRQLVEKRKRVYLTARFKREKRLIANSILSEIRTIDPPGRFLTRDTKTGTWYDIGDEKARDKTSQALRENAPSIRAEIEVEINHQRAEMQRVEDEEAAMAPPGPPPPYYHQPWGYYAPYHGYGQYHAEPPRYGHDERYEPQPQWHGQYAEADHVSAPSARSPSAMQSRTGDAGAHGHYNESHDHDAHAAPEGEHSSAFDVPNFVSSVPSSIAAWTRTSFSFGAHSHDPEQSGPPPAKTLPYVHDQGNHREGRRVVHFEDDGRSPNHHRHPPGQYGQRRYNQQGNDYYGYSSPSNAPRDRHDGSRTAYTQPHTTTAVTPESASRKPNKPDDQAIGHHHEADPYQDGEQPSSMLSQVANHILGSWDTSMVCTSNGAEEPMMMIPPVACTSSIDQTPPPASLADAMEDEEGQEIELVDMMDFEDPDPDELIALEDDDDIRDDEHRMPPPDADNMPPPPRRIQIDWPSKMIGCQSNWLPETFNAPSFFSSKNNHNPLSPSASLDMDTSAVGTEGISMTGSIGGASLCQVFSHDELEDDDEVAPMSRVSQQSLSQMPSWDRSVRSKSPSTICSDPSISPHDYGMNQ